MSEWMTLHECAAYLRISKETMYRLLAKKRVPVHRLGKVYRFNRKEIDKWMMKK